MNSTEIDTLSKSKDLDNDAGKSEVNTKNDTERSSIVNENESVKSDSKHHSDKEKKETKNDLKRSHSSKHSHHSSKSRKSSDDKHKDEKRSDKVRKDHKHRSHHHRKSSSDRHKRHRDSKDDKKSKRTSRSSSTSSSRSSSVSSSRKNRPTSNKRSHSRQRRSRSRDSNRVQEKDDYRRRYNDYDSQKRSDYDDRSSNKRNEPRSSYYDNKSRREAIRTKSSDSNDILMTDSSSANMVELLKQIEVPKELRYNKKEAAQYQMEQLRKKTEEMTGIKVPSFYSSTAINPLAYAEQQKKRKLLWSKAKDNENTTTGIVGRAIVEGQDEKTAEKFRKLMGIKSVNESDNSSVAVDQIHKMQKQAFEAMGKEYEFARMTTHTHRGMGLGFASSAVVIDPNIIQRAAQLNK